MAVKPMSRTVLSDLENNGFVVIPGPFGFEELERISVVYDSVVSSASSSDTRVGTSTTRVNGFADFEGLYTHAPLIAASAHIVGQAFKLSSIHARTLRPNSAAQGLHTDLKPDEDRYALAGFIFMVDEFREDNGATGFVPGSHKLGSTPDDQDGHAWAVRDNEIRSACGKAGSLIVFNGSVLHGHMTNFTDAPRRSVQGAFIPRDAPSATDFMSRINAESLSRLTPFAKYLLSIT